MGDPLAVKRVPISSVHKDEKNARQHSKKNIDAIKASLEEFGQRKPIVVDADGRVLAGNGTLDAALALGWKEIDIALSDLQGARAKAYAVADNRTSELAVWNEAALAEALAGIQADEDLDSICTGFNPAEIERAISKFIDKENNDDDVPEPPDKAQTKSGDLWVLGDHRLLCGNSGSPQELDHLLEGQPIHLVNTDPPYNVKVEPRSNNAIAAGNSSFTKTHPQSLDLARHPEKSKPTAKKLRAKDRPLMNDFVSDNAFDEMLLAWFGNIERALIPGGAFYIWGGYANCANYPGPLKKCGLYFSQAVIWIKEHPVLTRKDFMLNHEWCFYGWKEGAAHRWFGPNNAIDTWSIKKVNPQSMVHLTEKPVELATRAMEYSAQRGENVLDLFGGSGSTLIGAEKMGMHAFLMELDPLYCDVIVKRWEEYTGRKATRG